MNKSYILLLFLGFIAQNVNSQEFYRPSEALKNQSSVENLLIIPDKDDLLKISLEAKRFSKISKVKIRGGISNRQMELANKLISLLPGIQTLILESTEIAIYPENVKLNPHLEKLELYENDMLETGKLFSECSESKISKIILDVFDLRDIPSTVKSLSSLAEIEVYDRNSLIFKKNTGYDLMDEEIKTSIYSFKGASGRSVKFIYKSTQHFPTKAELTYLSTCFGTHEFNNQSAAQKFEKKYSFVHPPLEGVNKEKEIFTLNSNSAQIIKTERDNYIHIPQNAFTDKNGNPIVGNVDVSYREFLDPLEILMSGIPMKYDSAGTKNIFRSGGMFEITASVNGEEVFLAKDKNIQIDFTIVDTTQSFNTYVFDDKKGNWEIQENNAQKTINYLENGKIKNIEFSKGLKKFIELSTADKTLRLDTTSFERRFENLNFRGILPKSGTTTSLEYANGKFVHASKLIQITQTGQDETGVTIKIKHFFACNPELSFLQHLRITYTGSKKEFSEKIRNKYFNDARLLSGKKGNILRLKGEHEILSLPVVLTKLGLDGRPLKNEGLVKRSIKSYNDMLETRRITHNHRVAQFLNDLDAYEVFDRDQIVLAAYERSKRYMTPREKKLNFKDFMAYKDSLCNEKIKYEKQKDSQKEIDLAKTIYSAQNISKSGAVNKKQRIVASTLGIINCDRVVKGPFTKPLAIKFHKDAVGEGESEIRVKNICVLDKNNLIVYNTLPEEKISVEPLGFYYVFAFDEKGKLVWPNQMLYSGQDLAEKSFHDLAAEVLEKTPTTLKEIKEFFAKN